MTPTRRRFLGAATGGLAAFAGCPALSDPEQSLLISVHNYTDARHQGHLLVETDGTVVVHQYLEVPPEPADAWTSVETDVSLGEMPNGTTLDVTASFGTDMENSASITLGCQEYEGDAILVQFEPEAVTNPRLRSMCFDEFPSEASEGGTDRS